MKKLISLLIMLSIVCFSATALAIPYAEAETKISIEFEGITDADLGGESEILGDFEPHGDWQLTEGVATVVEGNNGNGVAFTPKYDNPEGYASCVMRAPLPVISSQKEGFTDSYGLRFYVRNDTWYDVYVTPLLFLYDQDGGRAVLGAGMGSYIVDMDGEYEYPNLVQQADACDATIAIPSLFEGYVVLPFSAPGGEVSEYDCGWQTMPGWTNSSYFNAENYFENVNDFVLDVRVIGFQPTDTESIVFDSFEFFGNKGDEVEFPDGELPDQPSVTTTEAVTATPTDEVTVEPTDETTEATTDEATEQPTEQATEGGDNPESDNTGLIIIIAVAAAVIIAAAVVIIIVQKKKKAN